MVSSIACTAFQEMAEAAGAIMNPAIQRWKDGGGRVVGFFCSSFPEELIAAAGILPFRMRATGSQGTELSDSYFSSINCSFPRHAFNLALLGEFEFLDGLLLFNSCDNIRRVYDHWKRQVNTPYVRIISLPKKTDPAQVEWFREEMSLLRENMGKHFEVEITDDSLWETIKLYNKTRQLLRKLYALRKSEKPPITGAEMLAVTVAGTAMPKDHYNKLLEELIADIDGTEGNDGYRARLMVMGGELDNPGYLEAIEGQGGLVVTDSLCFGSRMFWEDVDEGADDPMAALAQYYVADRPTCPRVYGKYRDRSQFVENMIKEFNVDGVILERLAFCDTWGFEQFTITNEFKDWDIPLMTLDREYTLSGVGQLRTRVQAFLETMGR